MVERFGCVHLPKDGYDIDRSAKLFAGLLTQNKI
jgi:hypothetical protein